MKAKSLLTIALLSACGQDDPVKENVPELITRVTLTFSPATGSPVVASATDPDGEGVQPLVVDNPIALLSGQPYSLQLDLINTLLPSSDPGYSITDEVAEEGDEHLFFFAWTEGYFSSPTGNGNLDQRSDPISYADQDVNGLPLGLSTDWATGPPTSGTGTFRVVLKHQPGSKSATSRSTDGESDLDVTFPISIK